VQGTSRAIVSTDHLNVRRQMDNFLSIFLGPEMLFGLGISLSIIGSIFWTFPKFEAKIFLLRTVYAAKLRESGNDERARKMDFETDLLRRRLPKYGRAMVAIGAILLLAGGMRLLSQ